MTPLLAALSRSVDASSAAALAASASPASTAVVTFLIAVLRPDLTALLRRRAFSLVRTRFFWLLIFATVPVPPYEYDGARRSGVRRTPKVYHTVSGVANTPESVDSAGELARAVSRSAPSLLHSHAMTNPTHI